MSERSPDYGHLDRRRFLRRAAVVGGTAWVAPTIITIQPAAAATVTSPPPAPPRVDTGTGSAPIVGNNELVAPAVGGTEITPVASPPSGAVVPTIDVVPESERILPSTISPRAGGTGVLATTGADIDREVIAALGAIAGGAALLLWTADGSPDNRTGRAPSS